SSDSRQNLWNRSGDGVEYLIGALLVFLALSPVIARRAIRKAYDGELVVRTESESLDKLRAELRRQRRRSDSIFAAGVIFLGGIVWVSFATQPAWVGWVLAGGGAIWMASRLRASAK
ncbi:MAG: hypothetical protein L0271_04165, partial [Gemmatimonadetes bacterium]|nr:hypothetical protein [Gemmatimonadota bacterium]